MHVYCTKFVSTNESRAWFVRTNPIEVIWIKKKKRKNVTLCQRPTLSGSLEKWQRLQYCNFHEYQYIFAVSRWDHPYVYTLLKWLMICNLLQQAVEGSSGFQSYKQMFKFWDSNHFTTVQGSERVPLSLLVFIKVTQTWPIFWSWKLRSLSFPDMFWQQLLYSQNIQLSPNISPLHISQCHS